MRYLEPMTKFNNEIPTWLEMLTVTARTTVHGGTRLDCRFKANKKRQQRSLFPARNLGDRKYGASHGGGERTTGIT